MCIGTRVMNKFRLITVTEVQVWQLTQWQTSEGGVASRQWLATVLTSLMFYGQGGQ